MNPTLTVFDLEFTTWRGALEADWSAPGQYREIVQIGALRATADLAVVDTFEMLVTPHHNPQLSDYFTGITGITQEELDRDGVPAARALSDFLGFCGSDTVLSYGNDMVVIGENVAWARARGEHLKHGFLDPHFLSIRPWINTLAPATRGINTGRLWQTLNLPKPAAGSEHSALFDCHSLLAAMRFLCEKGAQLPEGCVAR